MYNYPPNSLEFKKGFRLGVEKGRRLERKLWFAIIIVWMFGWYTLNWILSHFSKCS